MYEVIVVDFCGIDTEEERVGNFDDFDDAMLFAHNYVRDAWVEGDDEVSVSVGLTRQTGIVAVETDTGLLDFGCVVRKVRQYED